MNVMARYNNKLHVEYVYSYDHSHAYNAGLKRMIEIERSLDTPREHIRLLSISLPSVDKTQWKQRFKITYIIKSMYKCDWKHDKTNQYFTTLLEQKKSRVSVRDNKPY